LLRPWIAALLLGAGLLLPPLLFGFDRVIADWMAEIDPRIVEVFQIVTVFGRSPPYLVAAVLVAILAIVQARNADRPEAQRLFLRRRAERASFLFATVALAGIAANLIKVLVGRFRPSLLFDGDSYGFAPFSFDSTMRSFPSGHATTAFALGFAFAALFPRFAAAWLALAGLVAASRVVINAHYLGDVLGGALVAAFTMLVVRRFFAGRGWAFEVKDGRYLSSQPAAAGPARSPESR
jgi:membrane-associated phospholipid phosphatase